MTGSSPVLTVVLPALVLAACADRHVRQRQRDEPRDAGLADASAAEPPRIDAARLLLVIDGERVHVIGERGAVSPSGIEVEVQWPVAGELVAGDVAEDGSFDVAVSGGITETYRVQAVRRSPLARSEPVFVTRGQDAGPAPAEDFVRGRDAGPLSCEERSLVISLELSGFDIAGHCQRDEDCGLIFHDGCGWGDCHVAAASLDAQAVVMTGLGAVRESLCADYLRAGCVVTRSPFDQSCDHLNAQNSLEPHCVDGRCIACSRTSECESCSPTSCALMELCEQCTLPDIHWGPIGAPETSGHSLRGCRAFTSVGDDGVTCETELDCFARSLGATWYNASTLLARLHEPDIQAALRRHAFFGARTADAVGVELRVGTGSITVSAARCDGAAGCEDPPQGVTFLRDQLNGIVIQETARCRFRWAQESR